MSQWEDNLTRNGIPVTCINRFLKAVKADNIDMHSFSILRNGEKLMENYSYPFRKDSMHRMYSAGKGVVMLAVLLAVQEYKLDLNTKVIDFFKEDFGFSYDNIYEELTLYHMLTMRTGHAHDTAGEMRASQCWVKGFFNQIPEYQPGSLFYYNNGVPYIVSQIIKKVTGVDFIELLYLHLFNHMNVKIIFELNQEGEIDPSSLCIQLQDFVKLPLLLQQKGQWEGKQLIREDLAELPGKYHTSSMQLPSVTKVCDDTKYGYGMFLWRNKVGGYRFDGGRGQFGIVLPELDMVIAIMSSEEDQGILTQYIWKYIYPYLQQDAVMKEEEKLLSFDLAPVFSISETSKSGFLTKGWQLDKNVLNIEEIYLDFRENKVDVFARQNDNRVEFSIGLNGLWEVNSSFFYLEEKNPFMNKVNGNTDMNFYITGAIINPGSLEFYVRSMQDVSYYYFTVKFNEKKICIEINHGSWHSMRKRPEIELSDHIILPTILTGTEMGIRQKQFILSDGSKKIWQEYIPDNGNKEDMPLLICLHGGDDYGMRGFKCCDLRKFSYEKKVIVVSVDIEDVPRNFELRPESGLVDKYHELFGHIMAGYDIDKDRVFLVGFSIGELLGFQYIRKYGKDIASFGGAVGPAVRETFCGVDGELLIPEFKVSSIIWRGGKDYTYSQINYGRDDMVVQKQIYDNNKNYWLSWINQDTPDQITKNTDYMIEQYTDGKVHFTYIIQKEGGHNNEEKVVGFFWDMLFNKIYKGKCSNE